MTSALDVRPPVAGEVHRLGDLVLRVTAPNPGVMTGPGTNTYLVGPAGGSGGVAVIDPGPDDPAHLDRVAAAGEGRIRWILATHTHMDHSPGCAGLAQRTGAEVLAFAARDGLDVDRTLGDGDVVALGEATLSAIHTPGHASNHLCYLLEPGRVVFSGDHVMQGSTVVITPPDGDMAAYLASLRRLRELAPEAIAPGHGHVLSDPLAVVDHYLEHRLAREGAIAAALESRGTATVAELVADVYTDVPEALHPVARFSVWAHLRKLVDDGLVGGGPELEDAYRHHGAC